MRPFKSFTNALVVVSGPNDPGIQHARRLALTHHTTITLADVLETPPAYLRPLLPREWQVPKLLRAHKTASLGVTAGRLRRLGIEARIRLLEGSPVQALVREVAMAHHDLLVIAASAPGVIESAGTTAARLVRECPCPTLLARPSRRRRHRVLVAIDPRASDRRTTAMNALLLTTAIALAKAEKGELHVLHAWELYDQRWLRRQGLLAHEMDQFVFKAREEARESLERAIGPYRHDLSAKRVHLERGAPRKVIAEFVVKQGIDLLVIGTVARAGLARHLIGNTAEVILGQMPCSMLVVRPR
jgi:nucleotide-binding universal stress UspA family protein